MAKKGRKKRSAGRDSLLNKEELIVGRQAVLEALRWNKPLRLIFSEGVRGAIIDEMIALAHRREVPVMQINKSEFNEQFGQLPGGQGVAVLVTPYQYYSLNHLIELTLAAVKNPLLIVLDHIEDPHNLGAVMRTAAAAGAAGLIIPGERAAAVTTAVRKVAAGAAEHLPVARVVNLNRALGVLKEAGFWIYGAEADGDEPYYRADYCRPLVLALGSEGRGLSALLRKNCDLTLAIPMVEGGAGSLNVSASAAVLIYAALAQRQGWHR